MALQRKPEPFVGLAQEIRELERRLAHGAITTRRAHRTRAHAHLRPTGRACRRATATYASQRHGMLHTRRGPGGAASGRDRLWKNGYGYGSLTPRSAAAWRQLTDPATSVPIAMSSGYTASADLAAAQRAQVGLGGCLRRFVFGRADAEQRKRLWRCEGKRRTRPPQQTSRLRPTGPQCAPPANEMNTREVWSAHRTVDGAAIGKAHSLQAIRSSVASQTGPAACDRPPGAERLCGSCVG